MKIERRTFIVSGGCSGLGKATVELLHKSGGYVAILDRQNNEEFVKSLGSERAVFFEVDVTKTEQVEEAVKKTVEWTKGTGAMLGGAICAAGVAGAELIVNKRGEPMDLSNFEFVQKINVTGTIDLVRHTVTHLAKNTGTGPDNERGVIVMVASAAAFEGQSGQTAYAASKGAVVSMTLPLARDLGKHGIRVMTLAPSLFQSPMTSVMPEKVRDGLLRSLEFPRREGTPPEFAEVVKGCIEFSYLNGEVIRLSGGGRMPARL